MSDKAKIIEALGALLDKCENDPTLPVHCMDPYIYFHCHTREEFTAAVRAIGGKMLKVDLKDCDSIVMQQDGALRYRIFVDHKQVCERVVEKVLVPERPEVVIPAQPEHEAEIVSWVCPDSFLKPRKKR